MNSTSIIDIKVEAFKAFARRTTLRLDDLLPGLHQVRGVNRTNERLGSNGAGKSTLLSDAPTWCLYGRTAGGLRTTDVKSWLVKKPPQVTITIKRGKKEHTIQRGPRASDLMIDGRAVGQPDVDALVGVSYDAWCQAVVLGQAAPLFYDLAPRDKMTLLSDALGLERWERRAEAARRRAGRLGERLATLEGEIRGAETALGHARDALERARDASERWAGEQTAKIEEGASALKSARSRAGALQKNHDRASLAADSAGTTAKVLRPAVKKAREDLDEAHDIAQEHKHSTQQYAHQIEEAEQQLQTFTKEGVCPTCGQAVREKGADRHMRALRTKLKGLKAKRATEQSLQKKAEKNVERIRDRLAQDEARLRELDESERRAAGVLRLVERELGAAQARALAAEKALQRVEAEENPHREAAADARKHLRDLKHDKKEKEALAKKLDASAERAQFWVRGFREIRLSVIDEVLDDLRGTTADVLEGLGLGDWEVEYLTERETKSGTTQRALTVVVRSPAAPKAGVRWETYSGGERQRLRLAGALALSEVLLTHAGVSIDFRALDEPARGMSGVGVDDLCEVLADYARGAGLRIFFVDHLVREGAVFTSSITVTSGASGAQVSEDKTWRKAVKRRQAAALRVRRRAELDHQREK